MRRSISTVFILILFVAACGGGDDADDGAGDDQSDDDGGDDGDSPALDAGSDGDSGGPSAGLQTCRVTVTGDADSGIPKLEYEFTSHGAAQGYQTYQGELMPGIAWEYLRCVTLSGAPGYQVFFTLGVSEQSFFDLGLPLAGSNETDVRMLDADFSFTIYDFAPNLPRWVCSFRSVGTYSWEITSVAQNDSPDINNSYPLIFDGEFHGTCLPEPVDLPATNPARGSLQIDITF
jgi:hypothetical protein